MTRVGEWFRDHITVHSKPAKGDGGYHGDLIVSGPSLASVRDWAAAAYPDAVLVSWNRYGLTGKSVRAMFVPNPDEDLAALAADALAFLAAAATTSAACATIPVLAAAAAEPAPKRRSRGPAPRDTAPDAAPDAAPDVASAPEPGTEDSWAEDAFALLNGVGIEFGQHVDPLPVREVLFSVPDRTGAPSLVPTPAPVPVRATRAAVRREVVSTRRGAKPLESPTTYAAPDRPVGVVSTAVEDRPEETDTASAQAREGSVVGALSLAEKLLENDDTQDVVLPEGPRFADLLAGLQNFPEGLLTDATPDSDIVAKPRIPARRPAGLRA